MPPDPSLDNRDAKAISLFRHRDQLSALGAACLFLSEEQPFNGMPFGPWVDTLKGQILRGHYFFSQVEGRIVGYVGWALTSHQTAQDWIDNRREIRFDECLQGPCVLVMAARASGERVNRYQARTMRRLLTGEHEVAYWKRTTPSGTRLFTFRPRLAGTQRAREAVGKVNIEWIGG